tara:strand:- start:10324 stop:13875 length:3552 start_codon:yes stop_codon:yes gene_type:complete
MKNSILFGLMAILLLAGTITPSIAQSEPNNNSIKINEIELNPTGSDAGVGVGGSGINSKSTEGSSGAQEYVELYNPTSNEIDISGWSLAPTASWKTYEIPNNTIIQPNSFLAFTYVNFWFKDFAESVSLYDKDGNLIDETPILKDQEDDARSWQRSTDGFDTNNKSDWVLKRMTPISSNGQIVDSSESIFTINVNPDNSQYTFGETAIISGNISEKLYTKNTTPEIIKMNIQGPNYFKNFAVFPDRNLGFSTSLNLQEVLGFNLGNYMIEVTYGENTTTANFTIIEESDSSSESSIDETLELFTDKNSYIPGETVIFKADTNSSIKFGGLDYTVKDPNGKIVFQGTIFQNERFSTVFQQGAGQIYPFSTQFFMPTVNPVYGEYEINGIFKSQDTRSSSSNTIKSSASFNLVEDVKEDVIISISTDKEIYSVGDIIKVTGRSNDIWVEDLELKVAQTGVLSTGAVGFDARYHAVDPFTLRDAVRLNGDGTFEFEFRVVADSTKQENYDKFYGDYKVTVSEYFGDGTTYFKIVEDPETFIDVRTPLGLKTDKSEYTLGTGLTITGKILNYHVAEMSNNMRNSVEISFTDSTGAPIHYVFDANNASNAVAKGGSDDITEEMIFLAYPDSVGGYNMKVVLTPIQFDYGKYNINAIHPLSGNSETIQFEIKSAQSEIVPQEETIEPLTMEVCKSNTSHIETILKDLKRIGKGEIPPSMETVDCSENLVFNVGEKLIVKGKVELRDPTSLTSTSANPSGQTQGGHSYSTNYAEAIRNYIDVSIPYPYSLDVKGAARVTTVPNADENYTGGGGSGEGGSYYRDADGNVIRGDVDKKTSRTDEAKRTGYDGTVILKKQKLLLTDMNSKAYPDKEGNYATVFELRAGVFNDGVYALKADYFGYHKETSIIINDKSLKGGEKPKININLEKDEFVPGETVKINGLIENVYYYDKVSVKVEPPDVSQINCFIGQQCGFGAEKKLRVVEGVVGPEFFWNYKISEDDSPLGKYTIIAKTHFGTEEKSFFVVSESEIITTTPAESTKVGTSTSKKIIEKFNRISDNEIPILLTEKSADESTLFPRVIQGSLFTSARGEESDVNLRITTNGGQCVIGQGSDCLVNESTRKPGAIYSIETLDGTDYKIRYSGNDVRLEKFSIVPVDSNSKIDISDWNVEIMKDEQPSRFYYKVSYISLE